MVTLAHTYQDRDAARIKGWWLQPKLDGVRCTFDGESFLSRTGTAFEPPEFWYEGTAIQALQETVGATLDGELVCRDQIMEWVKPEFDPQDYDEPRSLKNFNDVVSVVRRKRPATRDRAWSSAWEEMIFVVFDIIDVDRPYKERYADLWECAQIEHPLLVIPVEHVIDNPEEVDGWLRESRYRGWEGVMLRNPDAPYERKRTRNLLKVKPVVDEEFAVLGTQPGTGKHKGRMGALICERNGETFKVGTGFTDADREDLDWIGKTITVEYFELTPRGVPRHPRYKATRDYE